MRISEVCTLKVANVHLEEHLILVHGKGDKERLENEYKETDEGKDLLELLDCIEKRDFDRTSM